MNRIWAPWRLKYVQNIKKSGCLFCRAHKSKNDKKNSSLADVILVTAKEIGSPIFFAISIIIIVFIPILSLQEVEGKMFRPLGFTVIITMLGSLIYALLIAPVLYSLLHRGKSSKTNKEGYLTALHKVYKSILSIFLKRRLLVVALMLVMLVIGGLCFINLGTEFVTKAGTLGFLRSGEGGDEDAAEEKIEKALKDTFRPEFLNRIDEIIIFSPLTVAQMEEIVDLKMKQVRERLAEHGLKVQLTESARKWLAQEGYDPAFGARPLQRALQKNVESPLSIKILQGEFAEGETVIVDYSDDEGLTFRRVEDSTPINIEEEVSA